MCDMRKIGILIERHRAFGRQLCHGIIKHAQANERWAIEMLATDDLRHPSNLAGFDGFIVRAISDEIAKVFAKSGRPVVDVFESNHPQKFAKVMQDAEGISRLAVEHFLQHRFTTFGFFGHEGEQYSDLRRDAFVAGLQKCGHGCTVYRTPQSAIRDFEYTVMRKELYTTGSETRSIASWVKKLPKPIAVLASCDLRAYQLIKVCRAIGVDVPSQVAVLGVDDDEITCNFTNPTISSVNPNAFGIGLKAAETLDAMIDGKSPPLLALVKPTLLVKRGSTATFPLDPPWLSDALVYIYGNVRSRLSAADVYRHVGRSHTVVNDAFRDTLGTTVSKAISDARLKEAYHLVSATEISLAQVASLSGFASVQYFTRSFTAAYGMSPSAARRNVG